MFGIVFGPGSKLGILLMYVMTIGHLSVEFLLYTAKWQQHFELISNKLTNLSEGNGVCLRDYLC